MRESKKETPRFEVHKIGVRRYGIFDTQTEDYIALHRYLGKRKIGERAAVQRECDDWNRYNGPPVRGLSIRLRF